MPTSPNEKWPPHHPIPWGKHKGKKLKELPPEYLQWLYGQPWIKDWPGLYNYLRSNAVVIEARMKDEEAKNHKLGAKMRDMETFDDYLHENQGL